MGRVEEIKALEYEAFSQGAIDEWVIMPLLRYGAIYGAFFQEELIGIAEFIFSEKEAYLFSFAIKSSYRHQGVGKKFLMNLCRELKEKKVQKIVLTSKPDNMIANHLYESLGFKATQTLLHEYGVGEHRYYFEKKLFNEENL